MEKAQGASRLITSQNQGVLCTHSVKHPGYPFGSVTPFSIGAKGRPIFLFSNMAVHTKNLIADPKASLLVSAESAEGELLAGARANVLGSVVPLSQNEIDAERHAYLVAHPQAHQWVTFGDFQFFGMEIAEIYYVGGFGVMGWVSAADYSNAASR